MEELRAYIRPGATVLDIGANIGNHTLFFAMLHSAKRVIPIEPNPLALKILLSSVVLNDLTRVVDLSRLGVGVSDTNSGGFAIEQRDRNIGAARLLPNQGDIDTYTGDTLFDGIAPDFIKIDVEGMEIQALEGQEQTIKAHEPRLFVEVDNANEELFFDWACSQKYRLKKTWARYKGNKNHLIVPA